MTPAEFRDARETLGFTGEQMARALALGKYGRRTIERIEAGANITGPMSLAVAHLLAGYKPNDLKREMEA